MAIFMIERTFAEQLTPEPGAFHELNLINADEGVRWFYSFLSQDGLRTFCLYEADSREAIVRAAQRAGVPADLIIEVTQTVTPDGLLHPIADELVG
ncbi:hypothetical protein JNB_08869 [Janibacter sp. HTCC2649]|uniref:DUF4242 domain-containing protein n=1 Tax=Janibacter sp. HTCC2649 TaxID=313589 RepID=UPI0000670D0C|nr:DUF4242 domain-containing protein [Janibacter sp. HTCC2649]EAQ00271.1 hypothetical protein JNB_08869 [Janibacter sp. HTCC2649]